MDRPLNIDTLLKTLDLPEAFEQAPHPFWEDEHISLSMLAAHLDPDDDGASRRPAFIEASAGWLHSLLPAGRPVCVMDLGCGPGLYTQRLAARGHAMAGMDFSRRSIEYARQAAARAGLAIDYRLGNYLEWDEAALYDAVLLIYCDYGALPPAARARLMAAAYDALKPGGLFILDVFSMEKYTSFEEVHWWRACPRGGFWSPHPHLVLQNNVKYPHALTLEQPVVLEGESCRPYTIWNQCFTPQRLAGEAGKAGFTVSGRYDDVAGAPYTGKAQTLALVLQKPA